MILYPNRELIENIIEKQANKKISLIITTKTWGTYRQYKFLWLFQSFIEVLKRSKINEKMYHVYVRDGKTQSWQFSPN